MLSTLIDSNRLFVTQYKCIQSGTTRKIPVISKLQDTVGQQKTRSLMIYGKRHPSETAALIPSNSNLKISHGTHTTILGIIVECTFLKIPLSTSIPPITTSYLADSRRIFNF
ncbi:hypothetical protein EG68_05461 [Paragonimus skrjabini miyazakii]|uniref:Uncharacterized protein n=1 Tax=Paragonimus skrjabini miyazakii TaxID=59628 RepID=A0A8S9YRL3_9TREM|nr:hypothetical protein EG68_05461 [Paragonimus skrjabini miyazakii]